MEKENGTAMVQLPTLNPTLQDELPQTGVHELQQENWREWFGKDMITFLLLGLIVPLPNMIVMTGANVMFVGITGVFGVCMSVTAAFTSFATPLFIHHFSYNTRVLVGITASVLCFIICTLGTGVTGPAVGTVLAGFVYAFGSNLYLAVAAFYNKKSVIMFSVGSGLSAVVGPALYIGFMQAFKNNWRTTFLVSIPFPFIQALLWWVVLSREGRTAAEQTRRFANRRDSLRYKSDASSDGSSTRTNSITENELENGSSPTPVDDSQQGFGPGRTRIGMFWKRILPKYVLPLFLCTMGAMFTLTGLAPTFQSLNSFQKAPKGDLNFQLEFFAYGCAQFLGATIAIFRALPMIWAWAGLQCVIVVIGIVQLFSPFLTYYAVWMVFMFIVGGVVGGAVTNTNYKVAEDFRKSGESEDVRAFAMSYGSLGNFAGDAIGGALAVAVQTLAVAHLPVRP
ncbi:battenin CLN3 protein [Varicellaria rhodocarpa]|nr:battenin CLN3 protein [Varicellaria rhodocarpa]